MEQGVDFTAPPTDVDVQLRALLQPGLAVRVAVDALMAEFTTTLALGGARRDSLQAVAADADLTALWHRFAAYDEATLPLRDLLPGENDDIEVLRVSPRDTWRLVDDAARGPSWPVPRCTTSAASSAPTGGATTSCGGGSTPPSD